MKNKLKFIAAMLLAALVVSPAALQAKGRKAKKGEVIRVMDYNIADGMWYDQFNNYDRFVDWMQGQDVDIMAICELATHWDKDKKNVARDPEVRYLPDNLPELAARWGHKYIAVGPYQDNYPVAFTSKYPIEVLEMIGGEQMSHGALHARINGVNYVVLHLWPQRYSKGDASKSDNKGEAFRVAEMEQILNATIRNPKYASETRWVMMGDFNSHTPVDKAYHSEGRNYDVHNAVRAAYAHDVIADSYPGKFEPSTTNGKFRIDFIYCSPEVWQGVRGAQTVRDVFADAASDHRPIVMELELPK